MLRIIYQQYLNFEFFTLATLVLLTFSCQKEDPVIQKSKPTISALTVDEKRIQLGRNLFYDPILSSNNKVSCASCHIQEKAFTDGFKFSSSGVSGRSLLRNTPAIFNTSWMPNLFWDGGAKNIESLIFAPLSHPDEMGSDNINYLVSKIRTKEIYTSKFKECGYDTIDIYNIVKAIATFQRYITSKDSRYDDYLKTGSGFSELELSGLKIYRNKCSSCHTEGLFTDNSFHNNGLDSIFDDISNQRIMQGRYRITLNDQDLGKYKTPTLRNLSFTAPYMHDGRFKSLDEVVEHYSSGVKKSQTLDTLLIQNKSVGYNFTNLEKQQLIAFLRSLDDYKLIRNPDYSNPY